ncbi:MAG TPA: aldehyde dehydrogenase family protein, partial [Allocoleopsis sp.]
MNTSIGVRNPRTGKIDDWITPPTIEDLTAQCQRLRHAQEDWQQRGLAARIEALQQWKQAVQANRDELIEALVADTGRLEVSILEVDSFLGSLDRWCRLAPELLQP